MKKKYQGFFDNFLFYLSIIFDETKNAQNQWQAKKKIVCSHNRRHCCANNARTEYSHICSHYISLFCFNSTFDNAIGLCRSLIKTFQSYKFLTLIVYHLLLLLLVCFNSLHNFKM